MTSLPIGGVCDARGCDMRREDQVSGLIESVMDNYPRFLFSYYLSSLQVERDIGPVKCAVHNIGANIGLVPISDTSTRVYSKVFC